MKIEMKIYASKSRIAGKLWHPNSFKQKRVYYPVKSIGSKVSRNEVHSVDL